MIIKSTIVLTLSYGAFVKLVFFLSLRATPFFDPEDYPLLLPLADIFGVLIFPTEAVYTELAAAVLD